jgi:hypothetical protein
MFCPEVVKAVLVAMLVLAVVSTVEEESAPPIF